MDETLFLFLIISAVVITLLIIVLCIINFIKNRKCHWFDKHEITQKPRGRFREIDDSVYRFFKIGRLQFVVCPFYGKINEMFNDSDHGLKVCQEIMDKTFGIQDPKVTVPEHTNVMSVPMRNFKCGLEVTDFEPICGKQQQSSFNYQYFGNGVQVTAYVEDDVAYVAGYCIYVYAATCKTCFANAMEHCEKSPMYRETEDLELELRTENSQNQMKTDDISHSTFMVRSEFCQTMQRNVVIGLENGATVHFIRPDGATENVTVPCATCHIPVEMFQDRDPPVH